MQTQQKPLFSARCALGGGVLTAMMLLLPNTVLAAKNEVQVKQITIDFAAPDSSGRFSVDGETRSGQSAGAAGGALEVPDGSGAVVFETEAYAPEFRFNAIGVKITGPRIGTYMEENEGVAVTASIDGKQPVDRVLPPLAEDLKEPLDDDVYTTRPVIIEDPESFSIEVALERLDFGRSPRVETIEIIYLDTTSGQVRSAATASNDVGDTVPIIDRSEWGCDESLGKSSGGGRIWKQQYVDPQAFIIHHTAGTDGGDDPSASIRAIYYWHTKVLGWGDIGYNYLVDQQGNIYHGRKGGLGVVGGHAYNTHNDTNFNEGSIGIAVLGCFESTPGACYTNHDFTKIIKENLARLIGKRAVDAGINLTDKTVLHGQTIEPVVGHRDVDYTYCPGDDIEDDLEGVIRMAKDFKKELTTEEDSGTFKKARVKLKKHRASEDHSKLLSGQYYFVTMKYKNTGDLNWKQGELKLRLYNGTGSKQTTLRHPATWDRRFGNIRMNEETVRPGEVATFEFTIKAPSSETKKILASRLFNGTGKIGGTKHKTELRFRALYNGEVKGADVPASVKEGSKTELSVTIKNTGERTWKKPIKLYINKKRAGAVYKQLTPGKKITLTGWYEPGMLPGNAAQEREVEFRVNASGVRIPNSRGVVAVKVKPLN